MTLTRFATEQLERHSVILNRVGFKMATALDLVPPGAERIEVDVLDMVDQLITAAAKRVIHHEAEVVELPRGTVLLCRENEVFWLPPAAPGAEQPRLWFAAGYDPAYYTWSDADVADWAPLTVLKVGA